MAEERWDGICRRILAAGQGPPPPDLSEGATQMDKDRDALRIEYLQAVLIPGRWYMVVLPVAGMDSKGNSIVVRQTKCFQLISLATGKSRPTVMRTALSLMMT